MKTQRTTPQKQAATQETIRAENLLDTNFFDHHEREPIRPHAPPDGAFQHWLSLEQIRKMQRMRRSTVRDAMDRGELPYEQRGRIRYARLSDVLLWEQRRLVGVCTATRRPIDPDFADLAG